MRIPMVPVSGRREAFLSGELSFSGCTPSVSGCGDYVPAVRKAFAESEDSKMMAFLDVDGLRDRFMNTDLLKSRRPKGRTVILITHVENEDDLLDGMCGKYDVLGIPYNTASGELYRTALELSDTATPVIFSRNGREVSAGRCLDSVRAEMRSLGFQRICILDTEKLTLDYEDSALSISSEMISMA